jgi:tetratricopeptide (TPR) repeat protein
MMHFRIIGSLNLMGFLLIGMTGGMILSESGDSRKDPNYQLRKIEEWREAAVQHNPGESDSSAEKIGSWDEEDLELVIKFVTKLASQSVKKARRNLSKASTRRILQLTDQEVRGGNLNRVLKQGALLHTDIAMLGLETKGNAKAGEPMALFDDGQVAVLSKNRSWEFARKLIDSVSPSPSEDPLVRQWYIATTAYLLSNRLLVYAEPNIENALEIFPSDDRILFYAGALHETRASPSNQNIVLPPRVQVTYGTKEKELKQARDFLRKSLEVNPNFPETHLRFGRVLGLLGNHWQAVAELSLQSEAREQYERAAMLYPTAQSPLFALSQLANNGGDIEGALLAMQRVFALPRSNSRKDDPWWTYDLSHVRDADALVAEMHEMFGKLPR